MCWCRPLFAPLGASCGQAWCREPANLAADLAAAPARSPGGQVRSLEDFGQKVAGLAAGESTRLLAEVKANQRLLESCPRHRFDQPADMPGARLTQRWRCGCCTGIVDAGAKAWYERGLAHAGGA